MFIEVTTDEGKKLINTSHIMAIAIYSFGNEKDTMITFAEPLGLRGPYKMIVKESYEEIKKLLM